MKAENSRGKQSSDLYIAIIGESVHTFYIRRLMNGVPAVF